MNDCDTEEIVQFRSELLRWGREHLREFPWRNTDRSFYDVFVAEFFLTQTPAFTVAEVYPKFLSEFPSLSAIDDSRPEDLVSTIEPLGFHRMRADALQGIAEEYDELPRDRDELVGLPRVGPYIADATTCFALEEPRPILDRNVVRVYRRVFGDDFPRDEAGQRAFASRLLPDDGFEARQYNWTLLDFGALLCQKRSPNCEECFATEVCEFYADPWDHE